MLLHPPGGFHFTDLDYLKSDALTDLYNILDIPFVAAGIPFAKNVGPPRMEYSRSDTVTLFILQRMSSDDPTWANWFSRCCRSTHVESARFALGRMRGQLRPTWLKDAVASRNLGLVKDVFARLSPFQAFHGGAEEMHGPRSQTNTDEQRSAFTQRPHEQDTLQAFEDAVLTGCDDIASWLMEMIRLPDRVHFETITPKNFRGFQTAIHLRFRTAGDLLRDKYRKIESVDIFENLLAQTEHAGQPYPFLANEATVISALSAEPAFVKAILQSRPPTLEPSLVTLLAVMRPGKEFAETFRLMLDGPWGIHWPAAAPTLFDRALKENTTDIAQHLLRKGYEATLDDYHNAIKLQRREVTALIRQQGKVKCIVCDRQPFLFPGLKL